MPRAFAIDTQPEREARTEPLLAKFTKLFTLAQTSADLASALVELKYDLQILVLESQRDAGIRQAQMSLETYLRKLDRGESNGQVQDESTDAE